MTAPARAVPYAALAGCAAYAARHRITAAWWRARWAWHCHGKPVPADGDQLTYDETKTLGSIASGRKRTARPERTRT